MEGRSFGNDEVKLKSICCFRVLAPVPLQLRSIDLKVNSRNREGEEQSVNATG